MAYEAVRTVGCVGLYGGGADGIAAADAVVAYLRQAQHEGRRRRSRRRGVSTWPKVVVRDQTDSHFLHTAHAHAHAHASAT
jgi:L-aminopeptidase/D-esterase-like protein